MPPKNCYFYNLLIFTMTNIFVENLSLKRDTTSKKHPNLSLLCTKIQFYLYFDNIYKKSSVSTLLKLRIFLVKFPNPTFKKLTIHKRLESINSLLERSNDVQTSQSLLIARNLANFKQKPVCQRKNRQSLVFCQRLVQSGQFVFGRNEF